MKEDVRPLFENYTADEFTGEYANEPPLTVGDLRAALVALPADMVIVRTRYSDVDYQRRSDFGVIKGVPGVHGVRWITRYHESMPEEDQVRAQEYLHIAGN